MIVYVIYVFVIRIFQTYSQRSIRQNALIKAKSWLNSNIHNWRNNKILNNSKNRQPELFKAFTKIKFKIYNINKFIREYKI
jgi:hypothetical protein